MPSERPGKDVRLAQLSLWLDEVIVSRQAKGVASDPEKIRRADEKIAWLQERIAALQEKPEGEGGKDKPADKGRDRKRKGE